MHPMYIISGKQTVWNGVSTEMRSSHEVLEVFLISRLPVDWHSRVGGHFLWNIPSEYYLWIQTFCNHISVDIGGSYEFHILIHI